MKVLANGFAHFIVRVCEEVFGRRQILFLWLQVELSSVRRDDDAGIHDRRSLYPALFNRMTQVAVRVISCVADVAHRGEAGLPHRHAVAAAFDRKTRGGIKLPRLVALSMVPPVEDLLARV